MNEVEENLDKAIGAITENPFDVNCYLERGIVWYDLKCYDECASDLLFYESCGGDNSTFRKYLGMALSKTSSKNSIAYLREYVISNPDDVEALIFLAETYFGCGDYQSSAKYYHIAVDKGFDPSILRAKASILVDLKLHDDASYFDASVGKRSLFRK